jgi:hypothetical protein
MSIQEAKAPLLAEKFALIDERDECLFDAYPKNERAFSHPNRTVVNADTIR